MDKFIRRVGSLVMGDPPADRKFLPYRGILYEDISEAHFQATGVEKEGLDVTSSSKTAYLVIQEGCNAGVDPQTRDTIEQSRRARQELKPGLSFTMGPWHSVIGTTSTFEGYENGVMFECTKPGCAMILVAGPGYAFEYYPESRKKLDLKQFAEDGVIWMDRFSHSKCFYGAVASKKQEAAVPDRRPQPSGSNPQVSKPQGLSFRERMLQQQQQRLKGAGTCEAPSRPGGLSRDRSNA